MKTSLLPRTQIIQFGTSPKKLKHQIKVKTPIRKEDGEWAKSDADKAHTFANHLNQVFKPHPRVVSIEKEKFIYENLEAPYQMSKVKISEIKKIIENLNTNKTPALRIYIRNNHQKLPEEGIRLIMYIFNAMLRLGYLPLQ